MTVLYWIAAWLGLSLLVCGPVIFAMSCDIRDAKRRAKAFADSVVGDRVYVPIDPPLIRYLTEERGFRVLGYRNGCLLLEKP